MMKMKWHWMIVCGLGLLIGLAYAQNQSAPREGEARGDAAIETQEQKVSYGIGLDIGTNLAQNFQQAGIEIDAELLARGLVDALSGNEPAVSQEELQAAMMQFQQEMQARMQEQQAGQQARNAEQAEENKKRSEDFLAENSQKEGVETTETGLQYQVIEEGDGPSPEPSDTVRVHYKGTLISGETFDSSYDRGQPATFPVNAVIPGWTEALQKMKVGSKWKLFIPPDLGYGPTGAGQTIGPNEALIFEVELLGIE